MYKYFIDESIINFAAWHDILKHLCFKVLSSQFDSQIIFENKSSEQIKKLINEKPFQFLKSAITSLMHFLYISDVNYLLFFVKTCAAHFVPDIYLQN